MNETSPATPGTNTVRTADASVSHACQRGRVLSDSGMAAEVGSNPTLGAAFTFNTLDRSCDGWDGISAEQWTQTLRGI